jgi:isocitrate dehydrogenase
VQHGIPENQVPTVGDKITVNADHSLNVPDNPIIPYIEGDGIGVDIAGDDQGGRRRRAEGLRRQAQDRLDGGVRRRKATQVYDQDTWLPQETLDAVKITWCRSRAR